MILEQAFLLLQGEPQSVVFYTLTLLALLAAFSIGLWQWRFDESPAGEAAFRLWLAAAALFFLRLATLAISLTSPSLSNQPIPLLPVMERTIDLASIALLMYALLPTPPRYPRLLDSLLIMSGLGIYGGYLLGVQFWLEDLNRAGQLIDFSIVQQSQVWSIAALAFIGIGVVWLLATRPFDWPLRALILCLIGGAYLAHLLNIRPGIDLSLIFDFVLVPYWSRFAFIVGFILLAIFAYRHLLASLLFQLETRGRASADVGGLLAEAASLARQKTVDEALKASLPLVNHLVTTEFVGVSHLWQLDSGLLQLVVQWRDQAPQEWYVRIADWKAFQKVLEQKEAVTLNPNGQGAREHHDFQRELGLPQLGMLLFVPIVDEYGAVGALIAAKPPSTAGWAQTEVMLIEKGAEVVSAVLLQAQRLQLQMADPMPEEGGESLSPVTHDQLEEAQEPAEEVPPSDDTNVLEAEETEPNQDISTLKSKIDTLSQSLRFAEEALARASAQDGEVDPMWVSRALNHYSAELEQAQSHITELEAQIKRFSKDFLDRPLANLATRFRSPLTAVEGYLSVLKTDLERGGKLDPNIRSLLRMVEFNFDRLLQLVRQLETNGDPPPEELVAPIAAVKSEQESHLLESVETAAEVLQERFRKIRLTLVLDIPANLPFLGISPINAHELFVQTFKLLISSLPSDSHLGVSAKAVTLGLDDNPDNLANFVEVRFVGQGKTLISRIQRALYSESGRSGSDMMVVVWYTLVQQLQARMWIELTDDDHQSTIVLVLPAA